MSEYDKTFDPNITNAENRTHFVVVVVVVVVFVHVVGRE